MAIKIFRSTGRIGMSLIELLAALVIIGAVATLALPRVTGFFDSGNADCCHMNQAEIELQAFLWLRANGSYPAANLSDITVDPDFFPDGVPACPVDGSAYTIDASGRVVGHAH